MVVLLLLLAGKRGLEGGMRGRWKRWVGGIEWGLLLMVGEWLRGKRLRCRGD